MAVRTDLLAVLPMDPLLHAYSYLSVRDLCRLEQVCTTIFHSPAVKEALWKAQMKQYGIQSSSNAAETKKELFMRELAQTTFQHALMRSPVITDEVIKQAAIACGRHLIKVVIEVDDAKKYAITGEAIKAIVQHCPLLQEFQLITSQKGVFAGITDQDIDLLTKTCKHLATVTLEGCCNVTSKGLKAVVDNCWNLQSLALTSDAISDSVVKKIPSRHANLMTLRLAGRTSEMGDESLKALKSLTKLTTLDVRAHTLPFTSKTAKQVIGSLPAPIQDFSFKGCYVSNSLVDTACTRLPNLRSLFFSACSKVTKEVVPVIAEKCKELSSLVLLNLKDKAGVNGELQRHSRAMRKLRYTSLS